MVAPITLVAAWASLAVLEKAIYSSNLDRHPMDGDPRVVPYLAALFASPFFVVTVVTALLGELDSPTRSRLWALAGAWVSAGCGAALAVLATLSVNEYESVQARAAGAVVLGALLWVPLGLRLGPPPS